MLVAGAGAASAVGATGLESASSVGASSELASGVVGASGAGASVGAKGRCGGSDRWLRRRRLGSGALRRLGLRLGGRHWWHRRGRVPGRGVQQGERAEQHERAERAERGCAAAAKPGGKLQRAHRWTGRCSDRAGLGGRRADGYAGLPLHLVGAQLRAGDVVARQAIPELVTRPGDDLLAELTAVRVGDEGRARVRLACQVEPGTRLGRRLRDAALALPELGVVLRLDAHGAHRPWPMSPRAERGAPRAASGFGHARLLNSRVAPRIAARATGGTRGHRNAACGRADTGFPLRRGVLGLELGYGIVVSQVAKVSPACPPPLQTSLPAPPVRESSDAPPRMQSSPPRPSIVSASALPVMSSLSPLPVTVPLPATTLVRVIPAHSEGFRSSAVIGLLWVPADDGACWSTPSRR